MDEKSMAILTRFPESGRSRSKLAPHRELICELHRRGCPFHEIAVILSENFGQTVAPSTVSRFAARQEQKHRKHGKAGTSDERPAPPASGAATATASAMTWEEIRQRIEAMKRRKQESEPEKPIFHYDPDKPLTLRFDKAGEADSSLSATRDSAAVVRLKN